MDLSKRHGLLAGLILLIIGLVIYSYLSYYGLEYRDTPDDLVSWFHLHVVKYIRRGGDPYNDYSLRYIGGRNLFLSPILFDYLIAWSGLNTGSWTIAMGMLYVFLIYVASYIFSKNHVVAGLSAILLVTTPCFIYWFRYNVYGSYVLQPIWLLSIILLSHGFVKKKYIYILVSSLLLAVLWLGWSDGWLVILIYSLFVSALVYKGVYEKQYMVAGLLLLVLTIPLNILTGIMYLTIYHIFSYISLLFTLMIYYIMYSVHEAIGEYSSFSIRILGTITVYPLAYYFTYLISIYNNFPGIPEDYVKPYNPLLDYGVVGLFTLLALILVIRSKVLQDIRVKSMEFMLITGFIVAIIYAYLAHPSTVVASAFIIPFIALSLFTIASSLYRLSSGKTKIIYTAVALWIVIGFSIANVIPAYSISSSPPDIYYLDLYRELMTRYKVNESALLNILQYINTSNNVLLISYWGYSYWITGYMGPKVYTLADSRGTEDGQKMISWILISDEDTAYNLIRRLVGNNSNMEVYILVSEIVSVNLKEAERGYKSADLGAAVIVPPQTPDERPKSSFQAFGDLNRVFIYLDKAEYNSSYYMEVAKARYPYEATLAWRDKMTKTVMVKLIVNGLKKMGYEVYNEPYMDMPLRIEKTTYFKYVNSTMVPIYRVTRGDFDYWVYYYAVLYKAELR